MKLCQDQAYIPQTADMIPGMYFSLDHFQQLREDPRLKGPHGAVRFAYDNVPSYLDNTMFARLVETGLVGTSGAATELVHQQVVESFNGPGGQGPNPLAGPPVQPGSAFTSTLIVERRRVVTSGCWPTSLP